LENTPQLFYHQLSTTLRGSAKPVGYSRSAL
jgi:hypothetical protein